jgi:surface protein
MGVMFGGFFGGAGATVFNQDIGSWDVSKVTSMFGMFRGANAFNNGGSSSINNWNISSVTSLQQMFDGARFFNQPIGNWNTSNVTGMYGMFISADRFNQNIGTWNMSKVNDAADMFLFAGSFNNGGSPSIGNWDTSKMTNMFRFFYITPFNQPIGNWDVGNVTNMSDMFRSTPFNHPIGNWNVSKVTNFSAMWWTQNQFDQDIGGWNPIAATNFNSFMNRTKNLSPANLDSIYINWSTKNVKSNLNISFGNSKYTSAGAAGRSKLINDFGWTISDGGQL